MTAKNKTYSINRAVVNYNKERDNKESGRRTALKRHMLLPGTLVKIKVADHCRRIKAPFGCSQLPVIIVNSLDDGARYQVKAMKSLLSDTIQRSNLVIADENAELARHIADSEISNAIGMSVLDYCNVHWMRSAVEIACNCMTGCKGKSCRCRKFGRLCGTNCHRRYYELHPCCKNYK